MLSDNVTGLIPHCIDISSLFPSQPLSLFYCAAYRAASDNSYFDCELFFSEKSLEGSLYFAAYYADRPGPFTGNSGLRPDSM